jgi:metal-dependent amidase/aminoacylase/carboxypeptidase family protein
MGVAWHLGVRLRDCSRRWAFWLESRWRRTLHACRGHLRHCSQRCRDPRRKAARGVDALAIGCALVNEVQKLVSRGTGPFDPLVISVTKFHAGNSYNVLAQEVELSGTVHSGRDAARSWALRRLEEIAKAIAAMHGAVAQVDITNGEPPVLNDAEMASVISAAVSDCLGDDALFSAPDWEAADDFGFYSQKVRSVYFRLGARDAKADAYLLHHRRMNVDERALALGASVLIASARRALQQPLSDPDFDDRTRRMPY